MRNGHLNLIGQRFGKLTVVKELPYRINKFNKKEYMWLCLCDCGETIEESTHCLRSGSATKCRKCYSRKGVPLKHGDTYTRLYSTWTDMKQRCYNKNNEYYSMYGGRGIVMCNEWKNNYPSFKEWAIRNGYDEALDHRKECSIDRIDVNKGYFPDNCRWTDAKTQMINRRITKYYQFNGGNYSLPEISALTDIPYRKIYAQLRKGKGIDAAVEKARINYRKSLIKNRKHSAVHQSSVF